MTFPSFPPLFPEGEWWRLYLKARLTSLTEQEAVETANRSFGMKPRSWMRFELKDGARLSVPVSGGASALKNRNPSSWMLAGEAAREFQKIRSTVFTLYGSAAAEMAGLIPDPAEGCGILPAADLCMEAFCSVSDFLDIEQLLPFIPETLASRRGVMLGVIREANEKFNPSLSILDSIARMGRDAIFPLLPTFENNEVC